MPTNPIASGITGSSNPATAQDAFAFLASEASLQRFVEAWKSGKLPKSAWTHAAHVAMAAYFAFDHAADATFAIMKAGILHHNTSVGTPNTEDNGYHETLTRVWSSAIGEFVRSGRFHSRFEPAWAAGPVLREDRHR